jgi:hypothetical protein
MADAHTWRWAADQPLYLVATLLLFGSMLWLVIDPTNLIDR